MSASLGFEDSNASETNMMLASRISLEDTISSRIDRACGSSSNRINTFSLCDVRMLNIFGTLDAPSTGQTANSVVRPVLPAFKKCFETASICMQMHQSSDRLQNCLDIMASRDTGWTLHILVDRGTYSERTCRSLTKNHKSHESYGRHDKVNTDAM